MKKIVNSEAFAEKLRVADPRDRVGREVECGGSKLVLGADRNCTLDNKDARACEKRNDLFGTSEDLGKISGTVVGLGRSNGDERDICALDALRELGGEVEKSACDRSLDNFFEARLVDRQDSVAKALDLCFVDIDTGDMIPAFCKTGPCNKANVTCSNDTKFHSRLLF